MNNKVADKKDSIIIGSVDNYLDGAFRGWACSSNFEQASVFLYIDDLLVKSKIADLYREDLELAGIGKGCFAFHLPIPELYLDGKDKKVKLIIQINGNLISQWEKTISLSNDLEKVDINEQFIESTLDNNESNMKAIGNLDIYKDNHIHGWACLPNFNFVEVFLYVDDVFIKSTIADKYRVDLDENNIGSGMYGYSLSIPNNLLDDKEKKVKVIAKVDGVITPKNNRSQK